jgi:hypothetical protein
MLSVVVLNVTYKPSMLSAVMLNVVMLCVVMLNVIKLSGAYPLGGVLQCVQPMSCMENID